MAAPPPGDPWTDESIDRDRVSSILSDAARPAGQIERDTPPEIESEPSTDLARGDHRGSADDEATRIIADAEASARRIVIAAEIDAERRSEQVLTAAQKRLDEMLDNERTAHARLRAALDEIERHTQALEHPDATNSNDPDSDGPDVDDPDSDMDHRHSAPPMPVESRLPPTVVRADESPIDSSGYRELVEVVKNTVRQIVKAR